MNLSLSVLGENFYDHSVRDEVRDPDARRVRVGKGSMGAGTE